MADPFEVRMRFTSQLQHLNASSTSAQKAAQYALKHRDQSEDLHSCILEQLERNNMNNRANIMYFIEHLCDMSRRESSPDYIHMVQRDILLMVDAVAPADGSGAANVKVVRRVLSALQQKSYLTPATVSELEACLAERDTTAGLVDEESPVSGTTGTVPVPKRQDSAGSKNFFNGGTRPEKRVIEQRIEEDRERHKRLRESIWAIGGGGEGEEYEKSWEDVSDAGEDDLVLADEERGEKRLAAAMA